MSRRSLPISPSTIFPPTSPEKIDEPPPSLEADPFRAPTWSALVVDGRKLLTSGPSSYADARTHATLERARRGWPTVDVQVFNDRPGRRARRSMARAGTRGRRGARSVPPCPLYVIGVSR